MGQNGDVLAGLLRCPRQGRDAAIVCCLGLSSKCEVNIAIRSSNATTGKSILQRVNGCTGVRLWARIILHLTFARENALKINGHESMQNS